MWLCSQGWLRPHHTAPHAHCRKVGANPDDVKDWVLYFPAATNEPLRALFASAYGSKTVATVDVPGGSRGVTVVSVWWMVPMAWIIFVSFLLSGWRGWYVLLGTEVVVHDERGLTRLLNQQLEAKEHLDEADDLTINSISF